MFNIKTGDLCNLHIEIYIWGGEHLSWYKRFQDFMCYQRPVTYKSMDQVLLGPDPRPTGSTKTKAETSWRTNKGLLRSLVPGETGKNNAKIEGKARSSKNPCKWEQTALLPSPHQIKVYFLNHD